VDEAARQRAKAGQARANRATWVGWIERACGFVGASRGH
jgi:hypothetical protein